MKSISEIYAQEHMRYRGTLMENVLQTKKIKSFKESIGMKDWEQATKVEYDSFSKKKT